MGQKQDTRVSRYAPVIVFAYNRADLIQKTLAALNSNELASESDLYVFSDGPKKDKNIPQVEEVRQFLREYTKKMTFHNVSVIYASSNQGLAKSVISGVNQIISKYNRVIVVEDDLICNHNFLRYMNDCLDYYQDNQRIWSISGYTYQLPNLKNSNSVYFTWRGSSWGWATWNDRWSSVNWDIKTYGNYHLNLRKRHCLERAGHDLLTMLDNQKKGIIDSWAVRWVYQQCMRGMLTVYPPVTLLHNEGLDGSGTHGVASGNEEIKSLASVDYKLVADPAVDRKINREFMTHFRNPLFVYLANGFFHSFHIQKHFD